MAETAPQQRIAIIGLGLIGGSIALALKRSELKAMQIAGIARSRDTAKKALKAGAIDVEAWTPVEAVAGARLVIIATPVLAARKVLEEIAPALERGAIVTDACSTKGEIARWARDLLPRHAHFVGGHPMAGKEQAGFEAADADLFRGKPWVVSPSVDAPDSAINTVVGLAQLCGAEPLFMDPDEHDSYVAGVSHLPLTVAAALFSVAHESAAWPELSSIASSGFRDTTRLASGSPEMAHDIVMTNQHNIVHWIDRMQAALTHLRQVVDSGDSEQISAAFAKAQLDRDNYMVNGPAQRESGERLPKVNISDFLLGSKISEMMRRQDDMIRASEERVKKRK